MKSSHIGDQPGSEAEVMLLLAVYSVLELNP